MIYKNRILYEDNETGHIAPNEGGGTTTGTVVNNGQSYTAKKVMHNGNEYIFGGNDGGSEFSGNTKYVAVLDEKIPDASRFNSSFSGGILGYKGGKWLCHQSSGGRYYIGVCSYGTTGYDYLNSDSRTSTTRNCRNDPLTGRLYRAISYNGGWGDITEITGLSSSGISSRTIISRNDNPIGGVLMGKLQYKSGSYYNFKLAGPATKGDLDGSYSIKFSGQRDYEYRLVCVPYIKDGELCYYYGHVYSYNSSTAKDISLSRIDGDYKQSSSIGSLSFSGTYLPSYTALDGMVFISDGSNMYLSTEEGLAVATGYVVNTDGTNFVLGNVYWCDETQTYCSDRYKLVPIEEYIESQGLPLRWKI